MLLTSYHVSTPKRAKNVFAFAVFEKTFVFSFRFVSILLRVCIVLFFSHRNDRCLKQTMIMMMSYSPAHPC